MDASEVPYCIDVMFSSFCEVMLFVILWYMCHATHGHKYLENFENIQIIQVVTNRACPVNF